MGMMALLYYNFITRIKQNNAFKPLVPAPYAKTAYINGLQGLLTPSGLRKTLSTRSPTLKTDGDGFGRVLDSPRFIERSGTLFNAGVADILAVPRV